MNQGVYGNIAQVNSIYDIRQSFKASGSIKVVFDSRIFNSFADSWAKMDADSMDDFVEWRDT